MALDTKWLVCSIEGGNGMIPSCRFEGRSHMETQREFPFHCIGKGT